MMMQQASFYKKKWDETKQKLKNNPFSLNYEENKITRKKAREYQQKYEDLTAEINDVLQAKEEYEHCVQKAKSYLDRAETLKKTYEF